MISLNYSGSINLTYSEGASLLDVERKFTQAATPYKFQIRNLGDLSRNNEPSVVSIEEISGG